MILLDTNVVSELLKPRPNLTVADWLLEDAGRELVISAITVGELRYGVSILPPGRRREALSAGVDRIIDEVFAGAVLPYDASAADVYGILAADMRRSGRVVGEADMMIAAIALSSDATLATRNLRHFQGLPLDVRDPFSG